MEEKIRETLKLKTARSSAHLRLCVRIYRKQVYLRRDSTDNIASDCLSGDSLN